MQVQTENKIDCSRALQRLTTDKCENCGLRPKTTGRKWCSRCIEIYNRKQSITPARILSHIETDYLSADIIKDFSEIKDKLLKYDKNNLFLSGEAGTGKTRAIFALLKIALAEGYAAERHEVTALCSMIRDTFNGNSKETENSIIKRLVGLDVLFLDDLGISGNATDFDYEVLYRIVDTRLMNCLPTIIASNKGIEQIGQIYDRRIKSRLQTYQIIQFKGQDKRKVGCK